MQATGAVLVVLLALYIGSQLASTLMMSATADKNQRRMMLALPLVFVLFIFRFPAGLLGVLDHHKCLDDGPAVLRAARRRAATRARG